jgi:hypothetical protein
VRERAPTPASFYSASRDLRPQPEAFSALPNTVLEQSKASPGILLIVVA